VESLVDAPHEKAQRRERWKANAVRVSDLCQLPSIDREMEAMSDAKLSSKEQVAFAMRQVERCRNYPPAERVENEDTIVTLGEEIERLQRYERVANDLAKQLRDIRPADAAGPAERTAPEPRADLDSKAQAAFEKQSANWTSVTPWHELAEETRQHWRDYVTRAAQPPSASHLAWLVESQQNGRAVWYTANFQWTTDASEAMWFVRQEDAELFCFNTEIEANAVEHMFCSQPSSSETKEGGL
jgi:hypothetical protein